MDVTDELLNLEMKLRRGGVVKISEQQSIHLSLRLLENKLNYLCKAQDGVYCFRMAPKRHLNYQNEE